MDLVGAAINGHLAKAIEGLGQLLTDKAIWLLELTLLCWVVIESGTAGWASTLVKESAPAGEPVEASDRIAAGALSAFWLCFMGARLLTAYLIHGADMDNAELVRITQIVQLTIAAAAVLTMLALVAT